MRTRRVLVVDDEAPIRDIVRRYLTADGFDVDEAADGEEALARQQAHPPDLVVLDLMMPGMDGLEVLRQLRRRSDVYVILLTAKAEEVDKVVGLSVGADDYLTKPFSPRELAARVSAILRRGRASTATPTAEDVVRRGSLEVDRGMRTVTRDGGDIALTALEFDLLTALVEAPGRVFTRRQLLERVWGWDYVGDERVVDVHIRNLRRALGDDANDPQLIATVRGVGYKFVGGAA